MGNFSYNLLRVGWALILPIHLLGQSLPQQSVAAMHLTNTKASTFTNPKKVEVLFEVVASNIETNKKSNSLRKDPSGGRAIGEGITKVIRTAGNYVTPGVDLESGRGGGIEVNILGGAADISDGINNYIYKKRDLEASTALYQDYKKDARRLEDAVLKGCAYQVSCIDKVTKQKEQDRAIFQAEQEQGIVGWTDATLKSARQKAVEHEQNGAIQTTQQMVASVSSEVDAGFRTMTSQLRRQEGKLNSIAKTTATIVHNQAALASYMVDMDKRLTGQLTTINETTVSTYLMVDALHDLNIKMDTKLDKLLEKDRIELIQKEFNGLTVTKQLKELQNPNSEIAKLYKDPKQLDKDIEALKIAQVQIVMKRANEYGLVAVEAINTFCRDCPPELSKGLQLGMSVTNIAGQVMSGNYAQAVLGAIGLFKKPQPSPEMQMLNRIQNQIGQLEQNMNTQFKGIHESIAKSEKHLTDKLNQIDQKLDGIYNRMDAFKQSMDVQLGTINSQLNFIIGQNKCLQDMLLKSNNFQVCSGVVEQWNKKTANKEINSLADAKDFIDGNPACKLCVERLTESLGRKVYNDIQFRLANCPLPSENPYLAPEEMYRYVYESIFQPMTRRPSKLSLQSLLYIPKDVQVAPVLRDSLKKYLNNPQFELVSEDAFFRNYQEVILFSNYFLTLFPLLELYDQGKNTLRSGEEIKLNPGLSSSRLAYLKTGLKDILVLIDHTVMQQNLLCGNGIFHNVDGILSKYVEEKERTFSLKDAFAYNPYLNKNYSYYYLLNNFDYTELQTISKNLWPAATGTKKAISNQRYLKTEFIKSNPNQIQFRVFLKKQGTSEYLTEPVFTSTLPVFDGDLKKSVFEASLEFVTPASLQSLYEARDRIVSKLAEIDLVTSPELDKPNSLFSRQDLKTVVCLLGQSDN